MLNRNQIIEYIKCGQIVIDPFDENKLNPNSYDVTLGNWFVYPEWNDGELFFSAPVYVADDGYIDLMPGTTTLCITKEIVGCVNGCVASMRAKSSIGRSGIAVCKCAGLGDVGYVNRWTGELTAFTNNPARMYIGQPFAQFQFDGTALLPKKYTYNGQYTKNDFPYYMIPKRYRRRWTATYYAYIDSIKEKFGITD